MIRRSHASDANDDFQMLRAAMRAGMTALADANVEARVREYFLQHPSYRRDAVHVEAVACRFQAERASLPVPLEKSIQSNPVSPRL